MSEGLRERAWGCGQVAVDCAPWINLPIAKHGLTRITQFRSSESLSSPQCARPEKIRTGVSHFWAAKSASAQPNPLSPKALVRDEAISGFFAA
jgi:hypothetical protein